MGVTFQGVGIYLLGALVIFNKKKSIFQSNGWRSVKVLISPSNSAIGVEMIISLEAHSSKLCKVLNGITII